MDYKRLTQLDGKAAVFVRGMMEFIDSYPQDDDGGIPLRKAQEAGLAAVEEQGESISIAYVSKLSAMLQETNVIRKERKGKKYILTGWVKYDEFITFLSENSMGKTITKELPLEQVKARSEFLDLMGQNGAVRISQDHQLDKAAYQVAIEKFKAGKYDMIFIDKDLTAEASAPEADHLVQEITFIPSTSYASVANR